MKSISLAVQLHMRAPKSPNFPSKFLNSGYFLGFGIFGHKERKPQIVKFVFDWSRNIRFFITLKGHNYEFRWILFQKHFDLNDYIS